MKKVKKKNESYAIKAEGNEKQYEHQEKLKETFVDVKESVQKKQLENALEKVEEGIKLAADLMKLIKAADRREFGWKAANEYEQDEFASDSAVEKRIFRSERSQIKPKERER